MALFSPSCALGSHPSAEIHDHASQAGRRLGQVAHAEPACDHGPERAPQRSYYYAMGLGTKEIEQPFVGVASCWNQAAPCNTALMRQAQVVSEGVKAAGGTPREFCTITVTDGIAMGNEGMRSSLVSREVIAELGRAHHARPQL